MEKFEKFQKQKIQNAEDTLGNEYSSINDFWRKELDTEYIENEKSKNGGEEDDLKRIGGKDQWYDKQKTYWDGQPTTIDGVLGGYGKFHHMEADYSVRIFT